MGLTKDTIFIDSNSMFEGSYTYFLRIKKDTCFILKKWV
jgi:hypothetical protein